MKRHSLFLAILSLCTAPALHGQDAALEERVNKLNGYVQDLLEDKSNQRKQLESLSREIQSLRDQTSKPSGNYASQDDLRKLAEAIKEIDEKREADKKLILKEIEKLGKLIAASPPPSKPTKPKDQTENSEAGKGSEGYYHTVAPGDTVSTISLAYREKGIKVSVDQILKANPDLVPEKMPVGKKIWIPAPK